MTARWLPAGRTGVDAGTILITDPCYVVRDPGDHQYAPYASTDAFWSHVGDFGDNSSTAQITNEFGADVGVAITNFGGDGVFPVYIQVDLDTGRVIGAQIRFDGEAPR